MTKLKIKFAVAIITIYFKLKFVPKGPSKMFIYVKVDIQKIKILIFDRVKFMAPIENDKIRTK